VTEEQLAELRRLAEAATPGPWWIEGYASMFGVFANNTDEQPETICDLPDDSRYSQNNTSGGQGVPPTKDAGKIMNTESFAEKNAQMVAALRGGSEYVYFEADQEYYSLIGLLIGSSMERMPAPVLAELINSASTGKRDIAAALGREPALVLPRNTDWQAGDRLLADICKTLAAAEGDAWCDEDGSRLTIHTMVSRDPSQRNNGGEYDFYRIYQVTPVGVVVENDWSCDIQPLSEGADVYMTAVDDLRPLLAQAQEIVVETQRANRTPFAAVEGEITKKFLTEISNISTITLLKLLNKPEFSEEAYKFVALFDAAMKRAGVKKSDRECG